MSLTEAQVQFAAEFITLVVTASALALLVLRPPERSSTAPVAARPLPSTVVAVTALLVLGAASFVHGSMMVSGHSVEWVGLGRVAAAGLLILSFPYPGGPRVGRTPIGGALLRLGFLAWLVAGAAELASAPNYGTDALLVAGSLLAAAALFRVGRRSIAVRVAASGAATLLLVVIVLALALSTVISSSVQRDELNRLSSETRTEQVTMNDTTPVAFAAQLAGAGLSNLGSQPDQSSVLYQFAYGTTSQKTEAAATISGELGHLIPSGATGPPAFASASYFDPTGTTLLVPNGTPIKAPGVNGNPVLKVTCGPQPQGQQGLFLAEGQLTQAASSPICLEAKSPKLLGVLVVIRPLGKTYLSSLITSDPTASIAVVAAGNVIAGAGKDTTGAAAAATNLAAAASGNSVCQPESSGFACVAPLAPVGPDGSATRAYLVLTSKSTSVDSAREQLFRTLFLIAFGGTILALGLAVFTGDRITAGIRRLTRAASAIQAGQTGVRAGVSGDDEVASLGSAFDSMLDSVSAQSFALQAAAEDEARLRNRMEAVVAGMTDALVAVDVQGRITDFNLAAAELTGVEAARALGAPVEEVVRVRGEDGLPAGRRLFHPGERDHAMIGTVAYPGGEIPVAVSSGRLRGPAGEPAGAVLVFRDMRREHEVEQMKTEFLSRVGHELRTPLTGIMGYADILLRREVPAEKARSWHEEILHSARRLLRIVEMLEFFASEGAGRLILRPEPLDARALVNGITSSWSARLPANLSLGRRMSRSETMVAADRRWLTLAVDELIDNAVKFSPEGGRIVVKVADLSDRVEISVSDQGMGMTAQQYEVIFGDFVQADNSDTRRFGGLGLGLSVVRRVIEGHGGTIRGRSSPGRGTTFVIELPAWPSGGLPGDEGSSDHRENGAAQPGGRKGRTRPRITHEEG